jgi:hypothetical protein
MRYDDWPERLEAFIDSRRDVPFGWGTNDCVTFANDAVEAITGSKPVHVTWDSAASALSAIQAVGSISDMCETLFGKDIPASFAQRGDVVLMMMDGRETLGIMIAERIAGPAADGLILLPISTAIKAWRV